MLEYLRHWRVFQWLIHSLVYDLLLPLADMLPEYEHMELTTVVLVEKHLEYHYSPGTHQERQ